MQARITLIGMENYLNQTENKSLADSFILLDPESSEPISNYDKDTLLFTIINKGGSFEPLYSDPDFFYSACGQFWNKWKFNFLKLFLAFNSEYNPIHNYDSHEVYSGTITDTGHVNTADSRTASWTESTDQATTNNNSSVDNTHNEDDTNVTNSVSAFDSVGLMVHDGSDTEVTNNDNTAHSESGSGTLSSSNDTSDQEQSVSNAASDNLSQDEHTIDKTGNIGVMSTQTMLNEELKLRLNNLYDVMASEFLKSMTLRVY